MKNGFFNRVSLGIQSFDKEVLESNKRKYIKLSNLIESLEKIKSFGIDNINLDLMVGVYNQTLDSVKRDTNMIKELIDRDLINSITVYPRSYFPYVLAFQKRK